MSIRDCALKSAAFSKLKEFYDHREDGIKAARKKGTKVIAELGCDVPDELLLAGGLMPVRIYADPDRELVQTNKYLEFSFDPIVRAQFEKIIDGTYGDLVDAMVVSNSTDVIIRIYLYLREMHRVEPEKNIPEVEFIDWLFTRNLLYQQRNEFLLGLFQETVERWAGRKISDEEIIEAAKVCNADKAALRKIGELRHGKEVRINGSEALVIIGSAFFMDRKEHTKLVEEVAKEAASWPVIDAPRVFFTGSNQESTDLYDKIEASGVVIVGEDHDWGDRFYDRDFNLDYTVRRALVDCYMLREFSSKKAFTSQRVAALNREVEKTAADGVIFYMNEYEEAASWDYPPQKKSLEAAGKKTLYFAKMKWPFKDSEDISAKLDAFANDLKGGR
ncbi:MAG: 2-hydroxyacyl-CoA dehydratase [Lachnospiraceae bacterium]|nr:2-hydroxyacyl-CoA dehydratase [Lachnospiraceae bacterium]